jgi:hypothetical protein
MNVTTNPKGLAGKAMFVDKFTETKVRFIKQAMIEGKLSNMTTANIGSTMDILEKSVSFVEKMFGVTEKVVIFSLLSFRLIE